MSPRSNLLGGGGVFSCRDSHSFLQAVGWSSSFRYAKPCWNLPRYQLPALQGKARQGKARQGKARPALTPYQNFAKFIPRFGGVRLAMKISRYLQFGWPESLRNSSKSCESFAFRTPSRFCSPRTTGKAKKKPGRGAWFTLLEVQPRTSVLAVLVGPRLWVCEGWVCDPLSTNW